MHNSKIPMATLVLFLISSSSNVVAATGAEAASDADDIAAITDQIITKELDLFRLNATTKLKAMPHSPWAARRWTAIGATNGALTSVGALQTASGRFYWAKTPRRARTNYFATAARSRFIANCLSVGGATVELTADRLNAWQQHRQGSDVGTARKHAQSLTQQIDDLLDMRAAAVASLDASAPERAIVEQEGVVLKDMRDLGDNEFARFYAEAKGARLARNLGYIVSLLSNAESGAGCAYSGFYVPYRTKWRSRFRTRAGAVSGVTDIISGAMNVSAPFVTRAGGALERMSARSTLCKELDCKESSKLADLQKHQNEYIAMLRREPTLSVSAKLIQQKALGTELEILNQHDALRKSEQKAARSRLIENVVNSGVSGGTKIANGIGGVVGAMKYTSNPHSRFLLSGDVSVAYGAGAAFSTMETLRNQFWNELNSKRARDQHRSTGQILKAQIAQLDQAKKAIEERSASKMAATPGGAVQ